MLHHFIHSGLAEGRHADGYAPYARREATAAGMVERHEGLSRAVHVLEGDAAQVACDEFDRHLVVVDDQNRLIMIEPSHVWNPAGLALCRGGLNGP